MGSRPPRHYSERDLRALSTADLLNLIQQDIRELDKIRPWREPTPADKKARRRKGRGAPLPEEPEEQADLEVEEPGLEFHAVVCCNHHMGDFPPGARVRCPFCQEWRLAREYPRVE